MRPRRDEPSAVDPHVELAIGAESQLGGAGYAGPAERLEVDPELLGDFPERLFAFCGSRMTTEEAMTACSCS